MEWESVCELAMFYFKTFLVFLVVLSFPVSRIEVIVAPFVFDCLVLCDSVGVRLEVAKRSIRSPRPTCCVSLDVLHSTEFLVVLHFAIIELWGPRRLSQPTHRTCPSL